MVNNNNVESDSLLEEIIGRTVLQLLAEQKPITLPSLLQSLQQLSDAERIEQAEAFLKSAFTIRAA